MFQAEVVEKNKTHFVLSNVNRETVSFVR